MFSLSLWIDFVPNVDLLLDFESPEPPPLAAATPFSDRLLTSDAYRLQAGDQMPTR